MFSKLICAAVVAVALGQSVNDMKREADAVDGSANAVDARLSKTEGKSGAFAAGIESAADSLITVDDIVNRVADIAGTSGVLGDSLDETMELAYNEMDRELSDSAASMNDALESALDEITRALSMQKEDIDGDVTTRIATTISKNTDLKTATDALTKRLKKHTDCAAEGLIWNQEKEECAATEVNPGLALPKVNHRGWTSDDGRDHGWINERYVEFTKKQDDTYIRVFYHDNFRVHGHGSWARWHVMICDSNGNGCDYCNNPGRMQHWLYAYHQHQWWMNDHWSASIAGLCKSASNRNLRAGNYRLKVYMDNARYDIYTGHNQYDTFMVDEVFKF